MSTITSFPIPIKISPSLDCLRELFRSDTQGADAQTDQLSERLKIVSAGWVSAYIAIKGILDSSLSASSTNYFVVIGFQAVTLPFYLRFTRPHIVWTSTINIWKCGDADVCRAESAVY